MKKGALDSQPQVIKFISCLPMVGGSLRVHSTHSHKWSSLSVTCPWSVVLSGCTRLTAASDQVYQLLAHGRWFSLGALDSQPQVIKFISCFPMVGGSLWVHSTHSRKWSSLSVACPWSVVLSGCTRLTAASDQVYQLLSHGRWFSLGAHDSQPQVIKFISCLPMVGGSLRMHSTHSASDQVYQLLVHGRWFSLGALDSQPQVIKFISCFPMVGGSLWVHSTHNCKWSSLSVACPWSVVLSGCTRLTTASDQVYQLLAHGRWFSPGALDSQPQVIKFISCLSMVGGSLWVHSTHSRKWSSLSVAFPWSVVLSGCTRLTTASDQVYQLLAHGRWFSPGALDSQPQVIKFISCLSMVGGSLWVHSTHSCKWSSLSVAFPWSVVLSGYSSFFHHYNWSPWYTCSWNIAESGIKHNKSNQITVIV